MNILQRVLKDDVMSVHLTEGRTPQVKRGKPGAWLLESIDSEATLTKGDLVDLLTEMEAEIGHSSEAFLEKETRYAKVLQIRDMRTVVTYPPLSKTMEITVIRPIITLHLQDYDIPQELKERLQLKAEGVLIAGSPGNGKTTFAQALLELYYGDSKIIKTIEVPRDLKVPGGVTQYSLSHSSFNEVRDLLLLTRPDYTFFDEIRNPEDFHLFRDLRQTGIGMVGVIHAEKPIDAVQRFIGKVDLGMIGHTLDTVIFIKDGAIADVYELHSTVKTPEGMGDSDLARPVLTVRDFFTKKEVYELYTYGEQVVVMELGKETTGNASSPLLEMAIPELTKRMRAELEHPFHITPKGTSSIHIEVDEREIARFIGKGGANIQALQSSMGIRIDVDKKSQGGVSSSWKKIPYEVEQSKKGKVIIVPLEPVSRAVVYLDERRQYELPVSKGGTIKVQKGMLSAIVQRGKFTLYKIS